MDAATEACITGKLSRFTGDLAHYRVSSMFMAFSAQTSPGDNLHIYVWEDKLIASRLHCQIEHNEQAVYNTSIDVYDPAHLERLSADNSKL